MGFKNRRTNSELTLKPHEPHDLNYYKDARDRIRKCFEVGSDLDPSTFKPLDLNEQNVHDLFQKCFTVGGAPQNFISIQAGLFDHWFPSVFLAPRKGEDANFKKIAYYYKMKEKSLL